MLTLVRDQNYYYDYLLTYKLSLALNRNNCFHQSTRPIMLTHTSWDRYAIKAEVHRRGVTLTQLALDHGLGSCSCRVGLIMPIPAANRAIAAFLGVALHELWPDWYDAAGNRLRSKRKSTSIRSHRKLRATQVMKVTVSSRARSSQHIVEEAV